MQAHEVLDFEAGSEVEATSNNRASISQISICPIDRRIHDSDQLKLAFPFNLRGLLDSQQHRNALLPLPTPNSRVAPRIVKAGFTHIQSTHASKAKQED